jgi:polyketide synthase PksN
MRILEDIKNGLLSSVEGSRLIRQQYEGNAAEYEEYAEVMSFAPVWKKEQIIEQIAQDVHYKRILVFDVCGNTSGQILKEQSELGRTHGVVTIVKRGDCFVSHKDNCFEINPGEEGDYSKLFKHLITINMVPELILYLWPLTMYEENEKSDENVGIKDFFPLFHITRQCINASQGRKVKLVYAYPICSGIVAAYHTAAGGFIKSVFRENPAFRYKTIGFENFEIENDQLSREIVKTLINEAYSENGVFETRYNGESRYIRAFEYYALPENTEGIPIKENGVYLITGGMGGLGLLFARYIAKRGNVKIALMGRTGLDDEKKERLKSLRDDGYIVDYFKGDVGRTSDVKKLLKAVRSKFGEINGIFHCAGVQRDSLIINKNLEDIPDVLLPKISGTQILDQETCEDALDFFVMFSSVASVTGNLGQCDYAYGNAFMDGYAQLREKLKKQGLRNGKTLCVNWPLWEEGGMRIEEERNHVLASMGIKKLPAEAGFKVIEQLFVTDIPQIFIAYGDKSKLVDLIKGAEYAQNPVKRTLTNAGEVEVYQRAEAVLKDILSKIIKMPVDKIDMEMSFEEYGLDSVMVTRFNSMVEKKFGTLSKTILYEYNTLRGLAGYLAENYSDVLCPKKKEKRQSTLKLNTHNSLKDKVKASLDGVSNLSANEDLEIAENHKKYDDDIAIIGLSGRYPDAPDVDTFWKNLKMGKDCVTEIPSSRWNNDEYYNPDPQNAKHGKIYSKWGGFIDDMDKFDALFFNISPREAELMDPQERLFLQVAWAAMDDAGYVRNRNKEYVRNDKKAKVGVFVGVTTNTYLLWGPEEWNKGNMVIPNSLGWSIANRVSYLFNFYGPSMPVDTGCSSSLTAIHLACESIRHGECRMAIAGGVNLYLHPSKYISMCQLGMLSPTGRCHAFGADGDGFVPGEGVGAVILKPLKDAVADGDHIYAVIKGSAVNHGGKTSGYTVPSPNAQASLILDALKNSRIHPETISYIEAHGTGTALGDPIEIKGLKNAFEKYTKKRQYCAIGSVKSNIGHLEGAAGIAALTKVVLQMKYKKQVPSLHCRELNPNIDFAETPFFVRRDYCDWEHPAKKQSGIDENHPRRAAISSFGAGGANAHIILEEYNHKVTAQRKENSTWVFLLSAKDSVRLKEYATRLADFIENIISTHEKGEYGHEYNEEYYYAGNVAYTLTVGREAMDERLVVMACSLHEFLTGLREYILGTKQGNNWVCGNARKSSAEFSLLHHDDDFNELIEKWFEKGSLLKLAETWCIGKEPGFERLYKKGQFCRVPLPSYPFAMERYWIPLKELSNTEKAVQTVKNKENSYSSDQASFGFYKSRWHRVDDMNSSGVDLPKGVIFVFDASEKIFRLLNKKISDTAAKNTRAVLVKPGERFEKIEDGSYTICPYTWDDYANLLEEESFETQEDVYVLYLWPGSHITEDFDFLGGDIPDKATPLFSLIKSFYQKKMKGKITFIHAYIQEKEENRPLSDAVAGLIKSILIENAKHVLKNLCVVIDEKSNMSEDRFLELCLGELCACDNALEVRIDSTGRMIRIMEEDVLPVSKEGIELKKNGVYIITGGTGGLGRIFAEYLAICSGIKIILSGRSPLNEIIEKKLSDLRDKGAEALYIQADVCKEDQIRSMVSKIKDRYGKIDGVIHSAGINKDAFLIKKTHDELKEVLAPKIKGTVNIDRALAGEDLDFFIMFSSVSAVLGNVGQCDYSYANAFMDSYAVKREKKRKENQRKGRTLSINWPLWQDGGMTVSKNEKDVMYEKVGILPMPVNQGLEAWEYCLSDKDSNISVFYGCQKKIRQALNKLTKREYNANKETIVRTTPEIVNEKSWEFLAETFEEILKLPKDKMAPDTRFEEYGIDSITVEQFNAKMERVFGELSKTLIYEYQTMEELTEYIAQTYSEKISEMYLMNSDEAKEQNMEDYGDEPLLQDKNYSEVREPVTKSITVDKTETEQDDIAVIGISGRYPGAENIDEFWEVLNSGTDMVSEVPQERWDWRRYYHPDADMAKEGKIYCKWGGFIKDADKFDSLFFNISPKEAKIIDPQERLFLEIAWEAMEDAGYTRKLLKESTGGSRAANVGVFVGVTTNTYQLYGPEEWMKGNMVMPNSLEWSIANRISYIFNFKGPSMPVDTACSSSLTAIHLACESLRKGECDLALTGGVNLYLHPAKYLYLCQLRMLSPTGRCHSFGSESDGFVPGEGVGAVLLKPLKAALRDKDHIHCVIKGSAINHGGNTSGYTVPNPVAQTEVILDVYKRFGVDPRRISYIEAHGTGTALGDPIEINGLTKAFYEFTDKKQFCSIGSVKSNIGHLEATAGIAGLTKILLQMKHKKLVPSLTHSEGLNPNINFESTPFIVQQKLEDWTAEKHGTGIDFKRIAALSSFGAGGANAHVVFEEYIKEYTDFVPDENEEYIFVLSAKNEVRLLEYASRYYDFLRNNQGYLIRDICYTMQIGREPMEERLAIIAGSTGELAERLKFYLDNNKNTSYIIRGRVEANIQAISGEERSLENIAKAWVCGSDYKFKTLYSGSLPQKLSLPRYPFEREKCWIYVSDKKLGFTSNQAQGLHPMLDTNESTFEQQSYSKILSEDDFFIRDHVVENMMVLPGVAYIEMAAAAYGFASGGYKVRRIYNVFWFKPLALAGVSEKVFVSLYPQDRGAEFEVYTFENGNEKNIHSGGLIEHTDGKIVRQLQMLSPGEIKKRCKGYVKGASCYSNFDKAGLHYKETFNVIDEVWIGKGEALSSIILPAVLEKECENYILHPSIIDGALQTVIVLMAGDGFNTDNTYLPYSIGEIEIEKSVHFNCYAYAVPVKKSIKSTNQACFDINIMDNEGNILVRIKDYTVRATAKQMEKEASDPKYILEMLERGEIGLAEAEEILKKWGI